MLERVVASVVEAMTAAGISAAPAYPRSAMERSGGSFVRVGVAKAVDTGAGFDRYLGVETDPESGEREIYGLRCELELSLDVYAPLSEDNAALSCAALFDRSASVIGTLGGLRVKTLSCGAPGPDKETGMFRLSGAVRCAALLTFSDADSGDAEFTDFVLRGELKA